MQRRGLEILKARYLPENGGAIPSQNIASDLIALISIEWFVLSTSVGWLESEIVTRPIFAVAAFCLFSYSLIWSLVVKRGDIHYRGLSKVRKVIEAVVRASALGSVALAFWFFSKSEHSIFLSLFALSLLLSIIWFAVVPSSLKRVRGSIGPDIMMVLAGLIFCVSNWNLYTVTSNWKQSLEHNYQVLSPGGYAQEQAVITRKQLPSVVIVGVSTGAMLVTLFWLMGARLEDGGSE